MVPHRAVSQFCNWITALYLPACPSFLLRHPVVPLCAARHIPPSAAAAAAAAAPSDSAVCCCCCCCAVRQRCPAGLQLKAPPFRPPPALQVLPGLPVWRHHVCGGLHFRHRHAHDHRCVPVAAVGQAADAAGLCLWLGRRGACRHAAHPACANADAVSGCRVCVWMAACWVLHSLRPHCLPLLHPLCRLRQHGAAAVLGSGLGAGLSDDCGRAAGGDRHWHRVCVSAACVGTASQWSDVGRAGGSFRPRAAAVCAAAVCAE